MIQDSVPSVLNNTYDPVACPNSTSIVICFRNGRVLMHRADDDEISFPHYGEFPFRDGKFIYLFRVDEDDYFFYDIDEEISLEGFAYEDPALFRSVKPRARAFALVTARHICNWYSNNRICGRCGHHMEHDSRERMMRCPECGNMVFPVTSPAVIAAVVDGDKVLLTRYANRPGAKLAALVAGFNEVGETIERTVEREVMEETGLEVGDIKYYKSQPWGISGGLLMGFWCRVKGDRRVRFTDGELAEARWMSREELAGHDYGDISLTSEMIMVFASGFDPYGEG